MRKYDKIFAGLILVAMIGFWVVIAPASFVARTSEALPLSAGSLEEREARILTESQKRRQAAASVVDARIAKLKERKRDTPLAERRRDSEAEVTAVPMPTDDKQILMKIEDAPDIPVYY